MTPRPLHTLRRVALALAVASGCAIALAPAHARACGGLFCNASSPVNQAAERILFAENGDGTVTAVIEIQYQGPAEKFSWVLPVPGVPDVDVSSVSAFDRLQQATNPQYTLNTTREDCGGVFDGLLGGGADAASGRGASDAKAGADTGVMVLAQGTVGPFVYEAIRVDPQLSDPADVALEWLMDNGYDVGELGPEVLRPYLADGLNLLAFKLEKTADAGSIRPIMITYETERPFIPIRPTAVAANDDMGIMVWVVSEARAVPGNYKALELNEALINWLSPMSTYDDVVTAAADEAAGQGFVTEFARDGGMLDETIVFPFERDEWRDIQANPPTDPRDLLRRLTETFVGWDGVEDALRKTVTLPQNLSWDDFVNCPFCYADESDVVVDGERLLTEFYESAVKPMLATAELLASRPYVTRLYTTMSADEMTIDPMFHFNPDLDDVSNVHTAERYIHCDGSWNVTLPNGDVVYGDASGAWPDLGEQPAARKIVQLTTKGQGEVLEDNAEAISDMLAARAPEGSCGCRVPGAPDAGAARPVAWLLAVAVVLARVRRHPCR
jgi:hypothetical protein